MRFKRASADEVIAKRGGEEIIRAARVGAPSSWSAEERTARFVMTSQAVDRYGDVVVTAGGDLTEFLRNPVAPAFHDTYRSFPVGRWEQVEKVLNARPPRMEGTLRLMAADAPDERVNQVAYAIENGFLKACSIGFRITGDVEFILDDDERWTGGFRFNEWELLECSVVPIPANPKALAKSFGLGYVEQVLDTWARSPEGLIIPRDVFEGAYEVMKTTPRTISLPKVTGSEPIRFDKADDGAITVASWPRLTTINLSVARMLPCAVVSEDGEISFRVANGEAHYRPTGVTIEGSGDAVIERVDPADEAGKSFLGDVVAAVKRWFPGAKSETVAAEIAKAAVAVDPAPLNPDPPEPVPPAGPSPDQLAAIRARATAARSSAAAVTVPRGT